MGTRIEAEDCSGKPTEPPKSGLARQRQDPGAEQREGATTEAPAAREALLRRVEETLEPLRRAFQRKSQVVAAPTLQKAAAASVEGLALESQRLGLGRVAKALNGLVSTFVPPADSAPPTEEQTSLLWEEVAVALAEEAKLLASPQSDGFPLSPFPRRVIIVLGPRNPFEGPRTDHEPAAGLGGSLETLRFETLAAARTHVARDLADVVLVDGDALASPQDWEELVGLFRPSGVPILAFPPSKGFSLAHPAGIQEVARSMGPTELLQICEQAAAARGLDDSAALTDEPTLEEWAERLANEVRHATLDGFSPDMRAHRLPVGTGQDMLVPLWNAMDEVRALLLARTRGRGVPEAPGDDANPPSEQRPVHRTGWFHVGGELRGPRSGRRSPGESVLLWHRRILVVEDDPETARHLASLLQTAGCVVEVAHDGLEGLEKARRFAPEAVLTDIVMPGMDGLSLARALGRDIALSDRPIVFLSWKEDLLFRVRELGSNAAAFLVKESHPRTVLARVREVLVSRHQLEHRLRARKEVHGRLDGLTIYSLLEWVRSHHPHARVSVRDASYHYELEVRGGIPQSVCRVTPRTGRFEKGPHLIPSLVGTTAGRFVVAPSWAPVEDAAPDALIEAFERALARARGASQVLEGPGLFGVGRVVLDRAEMDPLLEGIPGEGQTVVHRLAEGAAPLDLLREGVATAALLDTIVEAMARHGAVVAIHGPTGDDLLGPAMARWTLPLPFLAPNAPAPPLAPSFRTEGPDSGSTRAPLAHRHPPAPSMEGLDLDPSLGDMVWAALTKET